MAKILRTTLIPDITPAADGIADYDLPVNPLSVLLLTVKAVNDTGTLTNYSALTALLDMITNVTVSYRGANVINASLRDLAVNSGVLADWMPSQFNKVETNDDVRGICVPILFGRRAYDPQECFPATRRGDLVLHLTEDIAVTGMNGLIVQAETIELLDATPARFVKQTTTSKVLNALGDDDIELAIGNDILGLLLKAAAVPTGAVYTNSFDHIKLQIDNVESVIAETNWESIHGELMRRMRAWPERPHVHGTTGVTVGVDINTREQQEDYSMLDDYAYIDFDPLEDGQYALKTAGAARVNLRVNTTLASATACRVVVNELVNLPAGAGAETA